MSAPPSPVYVINSDASDADDTEAWATGGADATGSPDYAGSDDDGYYQGDDDDEEEAIAPGEVASSSVAPASGLATNGKVARRTYRDPLSDEEGDADNGGAQQPSRKRQRTDEEGSKLGNGGTHAVPTVHQTPIYSQPAPIPQPQPQMPLHPTQLNQYQPPQHLGLPANAKPHHPLPGLVMTSFFGVAPLDAVQRCVSEWLLRNCHGQPLPNIEIEVKLGVLVDRNSGNRISLPVQTETVLSDAYNCEFRSDMTTYQHLTMNKNLNNEVESCSGQSHHPRIAPHHYYPIHYEHTYETDTVYPPYRGNGGSGVKRRVTTLTKTGQFKGVLEKRKVANLNVYCPGDAFDWRISINTEVICPPEFHPTAADPVQSVRRKDRVTYKHNFFQIDLTQVKQTSTDGQPEKVTHELEVEITNAADFLMQGYREAQGQPSAWEAQLGCVLATVRMLNRNAGPKTDPRKGLRG